MKAKRGTWQAVVLLGATLVLAGCTPQKLDIPQTPAEERLHKIGKAYLQACYKLGRAPSNFEEIKPYVEGDVPNDLLISPNDGEAFVILWGVDHSKLPPGRNDPYTVGGYEKNGKGGKRYVLRYPFGVLLMTDEAFRKSVFPPGHQTPS